MKDRKPQDIGSCSTKIDGGVNLPGNLVCNSNLMPTKIRELLNDCTMMLGAFRDWNPCKAVMLGSGKGESLTDRRLKSERLTLLIFL